MNDIGSGDIDIPAPNNNTYFMQSAKCILFPDQLSGSRLFIEDRKSCQQTKELWGALSLSVFSLFLSCKENKI